jgi:predicted metal-dependent phosphoesterase TrpH
MKDFSPSSEGEDYGKADIHIHSSVGDGMAAIPEILEFVETTTDLDVIAITDHDRIEGSFEARELASKRGYRFQVVTGIEVTTKDGHLLALYLESPVPSFRPLEETIEAIHAQGGLCVVPHPMSWLTDSILEPSLERIVTSHRQNLYLDGIETINPTLAGRFWSHKVKRFQERYGLAETGGSDAHFLIAVGSGLTLFPGRSAADLRRGLEERTTRAGNGFRVGLGDVGLRQIMRQLRKSRAFPLRSILRGLFQG